MTLPKSFAAWLAEKLRIAREELLLSLDSPRLAGLTRALHNLPPLPVPQARRRLERFERRVQKRQAAWQATRTLEDLHALRRALRRLRYAREYLEQEVEDLKALQEALGQLNDAVVALGYLDEFEARGALSTRLPQVPRGPARGGLGGCWPEVRLRVQGVVCRP